MPMAVITHRREKSINFGIAFLIVGVYYLLLLGSEALSRQGYLDPQFALWIPNTLFGLLGGILTYKLCVY
jgi:lipopolysaccharide export LptBFGC system permease protein LptF